MSDQWPSILMRAQISARQGFLRLDRVYKDCERSLARESERRYHRLSQSMGLQAGEAADQSAFAEPGMLAGRAGARQWGPDSNLCDIIEGMFDHVTFSPFEKHAAYVGLSTPKKYDYKEYDILEGKADPPDRPSDAHRDVLVSTAEIGEDVFAAAPELEALRNPFTSIGDIGDEAYEEIISGHPDRRKAKSRRAGEADEARGSTEAEIGTRYSQGSPYPPSPPVPNPFSALPPRPGEAFPRTFLTEPPA